MSINQQDKFKELQGTTIKSVNLIQSTTGDIIIIDIELSTGDKVIFGDNAKGTKVDIKKARDIEKEDITSQISKLEIGRKVTLEIKHLNREEVEELAKNRAQELGHPDYLNVVKINGASRHEIDFTINEY